MMFPGYTVVGELHRGRKRVVFRGRRDRDQAPVTIKTLIEAFPSPADLASLHREHEILSQLRIGGVPRVYGLERFRERMALVLEDVGGDPLKSLVARGAVDLGRFLTLAVQLTDILAALHRQGVIHKDINPSNVMVDLGPGRLALIDFSIATRLPSEQRPLGHPSLMEGTIAYMSPEQTGRMNRDIDYRTDFYSVGVTFYEMLTGRLPFDSSDPLEVIHGHIARTPPPPTELNAAVPPPLSDLVMKLLSKTAEHRYQSAVGLKADLTRCREEWVATGGISSLETGQSDVCDRFVIPQQLYGREREVALLGEAFDRVCAGATELMLVSGYSGIGKTSLIHEILKSLAGRKGYFVAGKFDQLVRDVPYGAMIQALQGLVRQVLSESEAAISAWNRELVGALGPNTRVVIDVIPEVELIVGEQPEAPQLEPTEAQNRFIRVIQNFVHVFADISHPLVVFLDDLQWADSATFKVLQAVLTRAGGRGLLVIGAYRDNEVTPTHSLMLALEELRKAGAALHEIALGPLELSDLERFVGDTLRCSPLRSASLAELVQRKTDGNPFFVTQFLKFLHHQGLLAFDYPSGEWRFDLPRIQGANMTDNVVELMAAKIQKLPDATQDVLRLAACIGHRFDLATLSTVHEAGTHETSSVLWRAVEEGLVVPLDDAHPLAPEAPQETFQASQMSFRFLHDRVQQGAYSTIPDDQKQQVHLAVGRLMLEHSGEVERDERIFDLVHQLNFGLDLVTDETERMALARLNFAAGQKAKASAAYEAARGYFDFGARFMPAHVWDLDYPLAYSLHSELAECQYLCGRFDEAEKTFDMLLGRARSRVDRAQIHRLRVVQYENLSRYTDALRAGREGLRLFGIVLTESEGAAALAEELRKIDERLAGRPVADLIDLPVMTDPDVRACARLLVTMWASAYIAADRDLTALIPAKMVSLSLEHGNSEESASGYLFHGITVGSGLGDFKTGHEFGLLALQVNEKFNDRKSRAKVQELFACFVNLWRRPLQTCVPHAREAYRSGLESGDFTYATYGIFVESWYGFLLGPDLASFLKEYGPNVGFLKQIRMDAFAETQMVILNHAAALQGRTASTISLDDETFDEQEYLAKYKGNSFFETFFRVTKLALAYTFEAHAEALEAARQAEAVTHSLAGTIWPAKLCFYHALTIAALFPAFTGPEREEARAKLEVLRARLATWADNCPENFLHQHLMVAAEMARVEGRPESAVELYEAAMAAARDSNVPGEKALAIELYARFWKQQGHDRIAASFLAEARYVYEQWGASAKVQALDERHPELLQDAQGRGRSPDRLPAGGDATLLTTRAGPGSIDLFTVVKAAQAISSEIDQERLLVKLMSIVVENAGAQRGFLILEQDGAPVIQALVEDDRAQVVHGTPPEASEALCTAIVNYVWRTTSSVVVADATADRAYGNDPYVARTRPRSIMCTPVVYQGQRVGVLYLENNLTAHAFTPERIQVMQTLTSQAAIALENAKLFAEVARLKDRLQAENVFLLEEIKTQHGFEEIVGKSPALKRVLGQIEQVAPTDTSVMICGETGTGKELVARAIHRLSGRAGRPLVTLNCGAIPAGLVESELFGHEKGTFTGAVARKIGRFELANGGTIFLDEIGDLPLDLQVKLLRVLQDGEIQRLGGAGTMRVDVRVIAASHRDLGQAVGAGRFREDLYYRLNVFPIRTPALRERREDIPLLVRYFVLKHAAKLGKRIETIPSATLESLTSYDWPGNVRELANVIERSVIVSRGSRLDLGEWTLLRRTAPTVGPHRTLEQVDREHIVEVLERTEWRVSGPAGAARLLGLKPTTLEARMKKLGIRRPR